MSDGRNELILSTYPLAEPKTEQEREASHLQQEVTALFGQLRHHLLRYLLAFGSPAYDAEEIVQEVFLALFRHLDAGKSRINLRAWVFKVAHNLALKHRYSAEAREQNIDAHHAGGREWADPSPNPEEQAQQNQRRRLLRSVFRALPEQDQWCLSLRAEGLRYREIADVLGISLGAVSLSLTRSLSRLSRADKG